MAARELPEEVPVALVYDGATLAVTMATPEDLVDFAVGFTLNEGIALSPPAVDVRRHAIGAECHMRLGAAAGRALARRRRATLGTSSCGLCGVRSLAQAVRAPPTVGGRALRLGPRDVLAGVEALRDHQPLHDRTRATHAAGFLVPGRGLVAVREDVGRHNALDKLAGALARAGEPGGRGAVVLTSRVSLEMVQKAAALGAAAIVAVSAPTDIAVRTARAAGLTLIANVRRERFDVLTHPFRFVDGPPAGDGAGGGRHAPPHAPPIGTDPARSTDVSLPA